MFGVMKLAAVSAALAAALVLATENRTGAAAAKGDRAAVGRDGVQTLDDELSPRRGQIRPIRVISVDRRGVVAVGRTDPGA